MIFGCVEDFSLIFPHGRETCAAQTQKGRAGMARPLPLTPVLSPHAGRGRNTQLRVPAELLRLSGRALAEHDVDQRRSAVVHRLVEGATNVFRVLDKKALAAKGFHDAVIAGAPNERIGLHVEHRIFRELRQAEGPHASLPTESSAPYPSQLSQFLREIMTILFRTHIGGLTISLPIPCRARRQGKDFPC